MSSQLNFGLVGAGRIGRVHAENLSRRIPEANLLAVADLSLEAAERCAADFQIPSFSRESERILDNPSIDAVVICSSTPTHPGLIEAAASAGKHIFCEKPLALDLQQIDGAIRAVRRQGVKLQVGFNRRFDPSFPPGARIGGRPARSGNRTWSASPAVILNHRPPSTSKPPGESSWT